MHNVGLAGGDHLIGDLDKERGHSLGGVVILRNTVDHSDGIHQAWNVFHHCGLQSKNHSHNSSDGKTIFFKPIFLHFKNCNPTSLN